jgi:hypothetical protein
MRDRERVGLAGAVAMDPQKTVVGLAVVAVGLECGLNHDFV